MWLDELFSTSPNLQRAIDAATHIAADTSAAPTLRQLVAAIDDTRAGELGEDTMDCATCQTALPDFLHAQQSTPLTANTTTQSTAYARVRNHLALCPYCTAAYVQVAEWITLSEQGLIPVAETYPDFSLAFLEETTVAERPSVGGQIVDILKRMQEAGKEWLDDTMGGVYLHFGPGVQPAQATGWAVKSSDPGALLHQVQLVDEELPGWEIEASVFADKQDAARCRIEVALYPIADPDAELAGIAVTLYDGDSTQTSATDAGGIAEFTDNARAALDQFVMRIQPPTNKKAAQ